MTKLTRAEEILAEFVEDIDVTGEGYADELAADWPDLYLTYQKAKAYLDGLTAVLDDTEA